MELSSIQNIFKGYLCIIGLNMSRQLLIPCIKMEPLNVRDESYFLWQDVSLLSQNYPKTCGLMHWWLQRILEIVVIIETPENPIWKFHRFETKFR